ncbi:Phosducin-like protein [Nymphon striatum]|nr:Phosducin-like protein [Nymphon striatum]
MLITCVKSDDTTNTVEDLKFTGILQTDLNCYIAPPGFLLDDEKKTNEDAELDKELDKLMQDEFMKEYMQKRMREMMSLSQKTPKFGKVMNLLCGSEFLDAIDNVPKTVTVIIHLYENSSGSCQTMNGCLQCLAQDYPNVKFCKLMASTAGLSKQFKNHGVPALLVYKEGNLIGNFVNLSDELGDDFFACDVENFLQEHGMLSDKNLVPKLIRESEHAASSQSNTEGDFELE